MPFGSNGGLAIVLPSGVMMVTSNPGRRIKATVNGTSIVYVYDAMGQLAAEYGSTPTVGGTQYLTADHLGSTRLVSGSGGVVQERHDYTPFGEEIPAQGCSYPVGSAQRSPRCDIPEYGSWNAGSRLKFTGKERDAETGLDYFGARYMSSAQGRFTSVDPTSLNFLRVVSPQRWNMYGYAVNNPLKYVDEDGEEAIAVVYPGFEVGLRNQTSSGPVSANLGHAGVVLVARDGSTHYFEYGRYNGPQDIGPPGLVQHAGRNNAPTPALTRDASGKITPESMKALLGTLSVAAGKSGAVEAVVLSTTDSEYTAMEAYLNQRMDQNTDPNRQPYSIPNGHDCGTLVCETLSASGRRSPQGLNYAPPQAILNVFLRSPFDFGVTQSFTYSPPREQVNSKICYQNERGKKVCQ